MSSNPIESILNSQYPVMSGGQLIPQSIGGDVAGEVSRAQQLGYTDDQIAAAIGGLMAGKAALSGNLSAWHALSAEFGPAEISKLFPDQGTSGGNPPTPTAPDAPNVSIGATRDSAEILRRLDIEPPVRPDGYPFCTMTDWNAHWKAEVAAALAAYSANPMPRVSSATQRLAATYTVFGLGTVGYRGRGVTGPFTAEELAGKTPGQWAEYIDPKGAGQANVV